MRDAVELVVIGDELLLGFTVDTNGAYLGRRLAEIGVSVARRTTVGDRMDDIVAGVREGLDRTGAVITTGGLGPTTDDLTRQAIAAVFGREMQLDEAHLEWMRERWRKRFNREMPDSNRRQAMLPAGARKLLNNHGSAPGAYVADDAGRFVLMLPGVPRELRGMTDDSVLPLLRELGIGTDGRVVASLTVRTTGIAESLLQDELTRAALSTLEGVSLAYLPGIEGVDLRLTARGLSPSDAMLGLTSIATQIRGALGESIYGEGEADLAAILLDRCRGTKRRLAVAESCTGGLLGARLTSVPGSSDVFLGGVIAYDDEVKVRDLGVDVDLILRHGAVSEEVVRAMAGGAQQRFGADVALAITGVAGPGGGTPEKPVGLVWVCAAIGDHVEPRKLQLWGNREEIRYRATQSAMDLARRYLR